METAYQLEDIFLYLLTEEVGTWVMRGTQATIVCCCKLNNTRDCDEHLFRQVSTRTGRFNCPYFVAPICTWEDALANNLGAPYIDDVMSYNSLTTQLFTFPFLVSPSQFEEMTFVY